MSTEFRTVYELLDLARHRPGMYGIGGKSLRLLRAFLGGLSYSSLDDGDPPFTYFDFWAVLHSGNNESSWPWFWLETTQSDEDAYETYFRLLDEYRQCRETVVARYHGRLLWPGFEEYRDGKLQQPLIPDTLIIGQWAPSQVYFISEIHGTQTERTWPFHSTVAEAIEEARSHWNAEPEAWTYTAE